MTNKKAKARQGQEQLQLQLQLQKQKQIPFGNDNKKSDGKYTQVFFCDGPGSSEWPLAFIMRE